MIKLFVINYNIIPTDTKLIRQYLKNSKHYNLLSKNINIAIICCNIKNKLEEEILNNFNIKYVSYTNNNKLEILNCWCKELNITLEEVSFMGYDISDIEIMKNVKLSACHKDSNKECLKLCNFKYDKYDDECIDEFCEYIININKRISGKITALIGVRKDSKRCKNKNIRDLSNNSNLLQIKINTLKKVKSIDKILVTSNCDKMLKIANDLGVLTHKRPDYYASDKCPNSDNFKYMVSICDTENIIYSPVTCPFIREKTYENIINIYKNLDFCLKYDSIVTVEELKEFIYYNNNPLGFESSNIPRSQDFNNTFKLTFGCNLMLRNDIIKYKFSVGKAPYFYKLNKLEGLDIDDNFDFLISQLLYKNKFMTINDINNYLNK